MPIKVNLGSRSYEILVGRGILAEAGKLIKKLKLGSDAIIITNPVIHSLYGSILTSSLKKSGISVKIEKVADSERAKSFDQFHKLINRISSYDVKKTPFIIAFGGGVVGDLAGFVASVYKRGIPYIQIPTTLLAQVDSAIGGKVAIDLDCGKNLIGSFYQPRLVISDTSVLRSLKLRDVRCGLAEILKYGVIKDKELFALIEKNTDKLLRLDYDLIKEVIISCSKIKAGVVEKDEFDKKDERIILNFGHTIGHAIETASNYQDQYRHGEAVAIGMVAAAKIAYRQKILKSVVRLNRIESALIKLGLPIKFRKLNTDRIIKALFHDKKFVNAKPRFVLLNRIGKVSAYEGIPLKVIRTTIEELRK